MGLFTSQLCLSLPTGAGPVSRERFGEPLVNLPSRRRQTSDLDKPQGPILSTDRFGTESDSALQESPSLRPPLSVGRSASPSRGRRAAREGESQGCDAGRVPVQAPVVQKPEAGRGVPGGVSLTAPVAPALPHWPEGGLRGGRGTGSRGESPREVPVGCVTRALAEVGRWTWHRDRGCALGDAGRRADEIASGPHGAEGGGRRPNGPPTRPVPPPFAAGPSATCTRSAVHVHRRRR